MFEHALVLRPILDLSLGQKLSPANHVAIHVDRLGERVPLLLDKKALEMGSLLPLFLDPLVLAVQHQAGVVARLVHQGLADVDLGLQSARGVDVLDVGEGLLEGLAVAVEPCDLLLELVALLEPLPDPGQLLEGLPLQHSVDLRRDLGPEVL